MGTVVLYAGRERPVLQGHPWVFSGAIARASAAPGELVTVLTADEQFLARGWYNPLSQIRVRIVSRNPDESVDAAFWRRRVQAAMARRDALVVPPETTAYRLIHAESDLIPGLVVDRYGDWLVLQALSLAADQQRPLWVSLLTELLAPQGMFERSDEEVRTLEGLAKTSGPLAGGDPPGPLAVREHGLTFLVDVVTGHKTGFYLDQRENRALVRHLASGRRVLNCFGYTGAFTVAAIAGGATETVTIESSAAALALAAENLRQNGFGARGAADELREGNVFVELRRFRDSRRQFDLIILDPPKFAPTQNQVAAATRGYKDINLLALKLLAPGGLLLTCSCSGAISADLFQKCVFAAAADAGVEVQLLAHLGQPADHPVLLGFPEGAYLKGLLCRVY